MASFGHWLPEGTSGVDLLALVGRLNDASFADGILVQLPLPRHIDIGRVIDAIDPARDVVASELSSPRGRLVGNIAFEEARTVACVITPVLGGVGPMTIACLPRNTLEAASRRSAA